MNLERTSNMEFQDLGWTTIIAVVAAGGFVGVLVQGLLNNGIARRSADAQRRPAQVPSGDGVGAIRDERWRQMVAKGYGPEHDDTHAHEELATAAACYLRAPTPCPSDYVPVGWPFEREAWSPGTRRENLAKAGALAAAEIDRLDRARAAAWRGVGEELEAAELRLSDEAKALLFALADGREDWRAPSEARRELIDSGLAHVVFMGVSRRPVLSVTAKGARAAERLCRERTV